MNLTPQQQNVYNRIPTLTPAEIARELGLSPQRVSQICQAIQRKGLLVKTVWGWERTP